MAEEIEQVLLVETESGNKLPLAEFLRLMPHKAITLVVKPSMSELINDRAVRRMYRLAESEAVGRTKSEQAALDRIALSIEAGESVQAADIQELSVDVLQGTTQWGQGYLVARANPKPQKPADEPCPAEIITGRCSRPVCRCWPYAGRSERGNERTLER